jgi:hypothetical protein
VIYFEELSTFTPISRTAQIVCFPMSQVGEKAGGVWINGVVIEQHE